MIIALHGLTTMHSNCMTDVRIARDLGYDGIEIIAPKLKRFMDNGHDVEELADECRKANIPVTCINALADQEDGHVKSQDELWAECEILSAAAKVLECPTIQIVLHNIKPDGNWKEVLKETSFLAGTIADIGAQHDIQFQLEPLAWTQFNSLSKSLEVINLANRDNLGTVVDFWHLWAAGETTPEDVAGMDSGKIYGIHICDGKRPATGEEWVETELRGYLLGDGDIPIIDWVEAVKATGYHGAWSPETLSPVHWEYDLYVMARDAKDRIMQFLHP